MRLLDLFFPRACLLCHAKTHRTSHCCAPCERELPILPELCQQCADPLSASGENPCSACQSNPPPFDRVIVPFSYEGAVRRLITGLKFYAALSHTHVFVEALTRAVQAHGHPYPDAILPLPLHPNRLKTRGFNQAAEVGRPLARALKLPFNEKILIRRLDTAPQRTLSAPERAANLTGAFTATEPLRGAYLAVVDDVMTTGHTLRAVAAALKNAGAARVDVWCFARALRVEVAE